ncbi:MAG: ribose-5-phosphate isomerase RpiA [Methylobacteriaceae bacterium]|nr:ribose-5-phosphate isomerase RpiA [Methylobacteriaceae bacterium]
MAAIDLSAAKRRAAFRALDFVRADMRLGLGTGSTATEFIRALGTRVADGLKVRCVATSKATADLAQSLSIPIASLDDLPELDLVVDGADEFDPDLRLIKGGGGALLREKIVAAASMKMVVIADASKEVARLGRFPLPVEVDPFGLESTRRHVINLARALSLPPSLALRRAAEGHAFVTDGGHYILDCAFGSIGDPEALARSLATIPGVMEHGLFIGLASTIIVADATETRLLGEAAE